jgi:hypothetical protein
MEDKAEHPLLDVPAFLREWPTWAAWAAPQKRPLDLRRSLRAAATDKPETWAPFDYAAQHARRLAPRLRPSAGVGILIAPPLVFIDLDDAGPPWPDWVQTLLDQAQRIGAYAETSASGEGVHFLVRVTKGFPRLARNRWTRQGPQGPIGIEVYQQARFCALTGNVPHTARPYLNEPEEGDAFVRSFVTSTSQSGAPVLTAEPPSPIAVPFPSAAVLDATSRIMTPTLARAFATPELAYEEWRASRQLKSLDDSLSAWRFSLYAEAARRSPVSPQPVYEFFFPKATPQHPGIEEWQDQSGANKKAHRRYADIQRAHALVVEDARLLALDLGETPPEPPADAQLQPDEEEQATSWAQLGLVLKRNTEGGIRPLPSSVNFIRVISRHPRFAGQRIERNLLDGTTRVNRIPMADTVATRFLEPLRSILDLSRDPPIQAVRDCMEVVADDHPYDPLVEYLDKLPKYEPPAPPEEGDNPPELLSTWLAEVGAAPSPDRERFARRILLGLVARAKKPGVKFDYVPVFEGPQGVGKSTLVQHLVTPEFYGVISKDLHSKDTLIALRGKWAIELDEMSAFRKSDEESRKSFFSTAADTFRPPYGRNAITVPRRSIPIGTTNDKQYLSDITGARRYLPIAFPREIKLQWFLDHRDELFAQALYHFNRGEEFHDTYRELNSVERRKTMDERLVTPAWQMRIIDHLRSLPVPKLPSGDEVGHPGYLTTKYVAELYRVLDLPPTVQQLSDAQLATFLRRAGYHSTPLGYRSGLRSVKIYGWAHPVFLRMTDDQMRGFLACFPSLFEFGVTPPHWDLLRESHLEDALRILAEEE